MYYFIVNETAKTGKGLVVWSKVKAILEEKQITYHAAKTKYKGHATELAQQISGKVKETGKEVNLVVLGGDGTLNEVVNGIEDFSKVRIGLIPTGSGNDFARGVGQKKSMEESIDRVLNSTEDMLLDLGKVTYEGGEKPCLYAISSGIGMDAIVCKKAFTSKLKKFLNKLHMGKLTYLLITIQTLLSMTTGNVIISSGGDLESGENVENKKDEVKLSYKKMIFGASMNLPAEGGGVPMAPKADPQDGQLSMCFAHGVPKFLTFFVLPFLVLAKHEKLPCFHVENFSDCHVELDVPMTLHADGEYLGEVTWADFQCIPATLRLMK